MTDNSQDYVLIVDDDADIGETIELILQTHGYACEVFRDGATALSRLESGPRPRVVLLDLMMPGMTGQEFRTEQLKNARIADVPVVVMTGDSKADDKAKSLGVSKFLRKPVTIDDLVAAVREPR